MNTFFRRVCLIILPACLVSYSALAGNVTIPNTFTSGTPAVAAEVNANFSALETAVNDNDSRITNIATGYDHSSYIPTSVTQKVFSLLGDCTNTTGGTETWDYARTPVGSDTLATITQTMRQTGAGSDCKYIEQVYRTTSSKYQLEKWDIYDPTGTILSMSATFSPALTQLGTNMIVGHTWGDWGGDTSNFNSMLDTVSLSAVESVTVPLGTYNNCLKVIRTRVKTFGNPSGKSITWYCPGIGVTKEVQMNFDLSGGKLIELSGMTP